MSAIGGPIIEVAIKGRLFVVAEDADANRKIGGFENELQANGDGSARIIKTRVPWMIDGLALQIDDDRADLEFLQDVADGAEYVDIAVTFATNGTWQGSGIVSGELQASSKNATAPVTLSGQYKLTQQ